ncbi:MAG TPA: M64 family metallopeptidase [Saprospiraceae bacterium]|nr:M64 family metallopeptidase [Saprospiraceae bacterium]HNT20441.1 M64 family metallopeptidase [Saprospiraceae bacterium]
MKPQLTFYRWGAGLLFLIFAPALQAQTFPKDSIRWNGDLKKFINLVFLGDGYQAGDLNKYQEHVGNTADYLFKFSPFKEYADYFNVYAIKVPSAQSGADHPRTAVDCVPAAEHPLLVTENYFNSTFDYSSIHRLLVPTNPGAVINVIIDNLPLYDQPLMLVNSTFYGGSGGSTAATASINTSSFEIMVHEIGHSFAGLADEYWVNEFSAGERANMSREKDPAKVRWKNWIGFNGVGVYPHGASGGQENWFRPHESCEMRFLNSEFCPVCKEAIVLRIMQHFGTPVLSRFPADPSVTLMADSIPFKVDLQKPNPNTLRTKWILNGQLIFMNRDSILLRPNQLLPGNNTLTFEVLDTTPLIRADNHPTLNTHVLNWNIQLASTGHDDASAWQGLRVYPNPVFNELTLSMDGNPEKLKFEIHNILGQIVFSGYLKDMIKVNTHAWIPGLYMLKIENGNDYTSRKILKQ